MMSKWLQKLNEWKTNNVQPKRWRLLWLSAGRHNILCVNRISFTLFASSETWCWELIYYGFAAIILFRHHGVLCTMSIEQMNLWIEFGFVNSMGENEKNIIANRLRTSLSSPSCVFAGVVWRISLSTRKKVPENFKCIIETLSFHQKNRKKCNKFHQFRQ